MGAKRFRKGIRGDPMKTQYQFIYFVKKADRPLYPHLEKPGQQPAGNSRKAVWSCKNNRSGDELGKIRWYPAWRQYCFFPTRPAIYSAGCLKDIDRFISALASEINQPPGGSIDLSS